MPPDTLTANIALTGSTTASGNTTEGVEIVIGGAGKTAVVERFLWVLPGGLAAYATVVKDETRARPRRLFVFSSYEAGALPLRVTVTRSA